MGHQHSHHSTKNLKVAFFLNLTFTLIELVGGIFSNSMAILSDALHDFGDSLSLGLSWYFQHLAKKGRTADYSYGYGRFSLLGAVINSIVLLTGSAIILSKAIPRILDPQTPDTQGMIYLAILGILVNGVAALRLRKGSSINEEVVSLHLLEDVLGWIAVLIGAIVMHFYNLPVIDPILSILIAGFIVYNVFKNMNHSLRILLQGTPKGVEVNEIIQQLEHFPAIKNIHDCHMWTLDGEQKIFSAHLVVEDDLTIKDLSVIKAEVRSLLDEHHIHHATLEFETTREECALEDC